MSEKSQAGFTVTYPRWQCVFPQLRRSEARESPNSAIFVLLIVNFLTGNGNLVDNDQAYR